MKTFLKLLEEHYRNPSSYPSYTIDGHHITQHDIEQGWQSPSNHAGDVALFLIRILSTEERLTAANPAKSIRLSVDPYTHPIHFMHRDDGIEATMSEYFNQAFGQDLMVHRNYGDQVPIYCGRKPQVEADRSSLEYCKALESQSLLNSQGDGMRAFVGVLLYSMIGHHSVLLIDEPEAFLHPPHARLIGTMLAKETPLGRQVFLATHSSDVIHGLLDANTTRVKVIHLVRKGDVNHVSVLDNDRIREVWNDPILRYSKVSRWPFSHTSNRV